MDNTFRDLASIVKADIHKSESWLVMADWLMEHDDIRGELIRLRYRLRDSVNNNADIHAIKQLRQDMDAIIRGNSVRWVSGMPPSIEAINKFWENGFITEISSYRLDIQNIIDDFENIYNHMTYAVIQSISISGLGLNRRHISNFVNSGLKKLGLTRLDLSYNDIDTYCIEQILTSGCIDSVKTLLLSGNNINDDGVKAMVSFGCASNMRSLSLSQNDITDTGVKYLLSFAESNWSLQYIDLSHNPRIRNRACIGNFYDMGVRVNM